MVLAEGLLLSSCSKQEIWSPKEATVVGSSQQSRQKRERTSDAKPMPRLRACITVWPAASLIS